MTTDVFLDNQSFLMLALDHRQSFKKILLPLDFSLVTKEEVIEAKRAILQALYPYFSGVLLDAEFGLEAYKKINPNFKKPFLLSIEKSGFLEKYGERFNEVEYSVGQLQKMGASGVKLLLYFNPFLKSAKYQLEIAKKVLLESRQYDLPLFLEVVTYQHEKTLNKEENFVVESVKRFLAESIYPAVFKLEYPGSEEACRQITSLLKNTPWILLTRGDSFLSFKHKLYFAIKNGASGFLAGRALWQDIISKNEEEKEKMLAEVLPQRFLEIKEIACQR